MHLMAVAPSTGARLRTAIRLRASSVGWTDVTGAMIRCGQARFADCVSSSSQTTAGRGQHRSPMLRFRSLDDLRSHEAREGNNSRVEAGNARPRGR